MPAIVRLLFLCCIVACGCDARPPDSPVQLNAGAGRSGRPARYAEYDWDNVREQEYEAYAQGQTFGEKLPEDEGLFEIQLEGSAMAKALAVEKQRLENIVRIGRPSIMKDARQPRVKSMSKGCEPHCRPARAAQDREMDGARDVPQREAREDKSGSMGCEPFCRPPRAAQDRELNAASDVPRREVRQVKSESKGCEPYCRSAKAAQGEISRATNRSRRSLQQDYDCSAKNAFWNRVTCNFWSMLGYEVQSSDPISPVATQVSTEPYNRFTISPVVVNNFQTAQYPSAPQIHDYVSNDTDSHNESGTDPMDESHKDERESNIFHVNETATEYDQVEFTSDPSNVEDTSATQIHDHVSNSDENTTEPGQVEFNSDPSNVEDSTAAEIHDNVSNDTDSYNESGTDPMDESHRDEHESNIFHVNETTTKYDQVEFTSDPSNVEDTSATQIHDHVSNSDESTTEPGQVELNSDPSNVEDSTAAEIHDNVSNSDDGNDNSAIGNVDKYRDEFEKYTFGINRTAKRYREVKTESGHSKVKIYSWRN
ncbi:PREDICTED: uncharacterized protein LOC105570357 [Vollenhovia emeryi]|uniref:uncharacterized protein LOC105570357 n=1 Tax=Vollenhovia emeryi TaxID=411798 RepID=UPI0005F380D9|nr:PREDICTED: uncharacterized protein LOC105570357 [Vollenhovia emeryi]